MLRTSWKQAWRDDQRPGLHAGALFRAATEGASIEHLLEVAASTLLVTAGADRVGLWLIGERSGVGNKGHVAEAIPGPIPDSWKRLDISMPFFRAALDSLEPVRVEFDSVESMSNAGLLVGMRSAVWIGLRTCDGIVGLAMVAHARTDVALQTEALRARANEVVLAISHYNDQLRRQHNARALVSQTCLSRAILAGVSLESILPQIARAVRHHFQAKFVAIGTPGIRPVFAEGWDGPPEWRAMLDQESILRLWHAAGQDGRQAELSSKELSKLLRPPFDRSQAALNRVVAIPVELGSHVFGVLLAGLELVELTDHDDTNLDSYALLAASAFDRERERAERSASEDSFEEYIEHSREFLVIVDDKGRLFNASPAAFAFLRFGWEHAGDSNDEFAEHSDPSSRSALERNVSIPSVRQLTHGSPRVLTPSHSLQTTKPTDEHSRWHEMRLEDFFVPAARAAVSSWCECAARNCPALNSSAEVGNPLDAMLVTGAAVQLHFCGVAPVSDKHAHRWLISFEDHDSRRDLVDAEERGQAELFALTESIDSGVLLIDATGNVRMASDRFAQIMEIDAHRLSEMRTVDALIDTLASRFGNPSETTSRWLVQMKSGEEAMWDEVEMTRPSRKLVERFARPILGANGTRLGWVEAYRDITAQRKIQAKLSQAEKMAALGQLVSGIAHELNNPLTSIQGYAQLLLERLSPRDRSEDLERISQEALRASRIVKNLLLFSRGTKPERRAIDLNEVVENTLALRTSELKIENIVVTLDLDDALPRALADAAQLQQIVLNLVVNAEQSIEQGEGHGNIAIRTRRLAEGRVELRISDDGPGIPAEVISHIFDPFFTTKPAGVGTGLGLSIVYGIVHEHGGEIRVESQPGEGATVTLEFRAAMSDPSDGHPERISSSPPMVLAQADNPPSGSKRILVLEDEPSVAKLIADVASDEGHQVDTLLDSREAWARLETHNYDLVICDLKMPHLDGQGFYRALVRSGHPLRHRLLFVTGDTMSPRTIEFLSSCRLPYLAKPFLVEELKQAIRNSLVQPAVEEDSSVAQDEAASGMKGS